MKIDTLSFINCMLCNHSPVVFHPHVNVLIPVSINCMTLALAVQGPVRIDINVDLQTDGFKYLYCLYLPIKLLFK